MHGPDEKFRGVVGDVARALGGPLIAPPVDATQIQRYIGETKGFGTIDKLSRTVTRGVSVQAVPHRRGLERAAQYGKHRSVAGYISVIWDKLCEDVRRQKCLVIKKAAAHEIPHLPTGDTAGSSRHTQSDN